MVAPSEPAPLVLRRRYAAPPPVIFALWTQPQFLTKWLRPSPQFSHQTVEVDAQVGGRYRIAFVSPEGQVDVVGGEFLEVSPPTRLVFTWKWEPPNEHAGIDSQVTVQLKEIDGETELTLTHGISDSTMRERHHHGWSGALDQIPGLLAEGNRSKAGDA